MKLLSTINRKREKLSRDNLYHCSANLILDSVLFLIKIQINGGCFHNIRVFEKPVTVTFHTNANWFNFL